MLKNSRVSRKKRKASIGKMLNSAFCKKFIGTLAYTRLWLLWYRPSLSSLILFLWRPAKKKGGQA